MVGLREDGSIRLGQNFLVRNVPRLVEAGFAVVVVDAPSDYPTNVDPIRASPQHAADVTALLDAIAERFPGPYVLAGHSAGTISAAYLGIVLPDPRIAGIVLVESLGQKLGQPAIERGALRVSSLPLHQLRRPVLFIHHRDDPCFASQYRDALDLRLRMVASQRIDFVTVLGGDASASEATVDQSSISHEQDTE